MPHIHDAQPCNYQVRETPLGTTKHIRIVGIGAGASGLNLIRTLRLKLTDYEITVYEKNADVGGTWFENRYPGCRCDVPSHNYQFSWRPKHDWSNFHASAEEIEAYLCNLCDEEGMRDVIKTRHEIRSARWDETRGVWLLTVRDLLSERDFEDFADFLLDGTGILNDWKWPDTEGIQTYEGLLIHSARWPQDFDSTDKTIVVIGNGASGVQLLPEVQPAAKKLYHVVRTPTWVLPSRVQMWKMMGQAKGAMSKIELDDRENFTKQTIEKFKSDPAYYRVFVKDTEKETNEAFGIIVKDSPTQKVARQKVKEYMTAMLGGDERLCRALIPEFPLGCRRMTPAARYLQALTQPNVELVTERMKRFVPQGIELVSGKLLQVDAVICATGFHASFRPRFPIIGQRGNLQDIRGRGNIPKAYMSCAVADFPNYFTFLGPNAPIGHGSVFTLTEHIANYIVGIIAKCQKEGIRSIAPSRAAVDDYFEHITAFMPRTAWAGAGRSWYKGNGEEGPVTALHPGSRSHFCHMLEEFRGEDWEYVYDNANQNRFEYLGNGFSTKELEELDSDEDQA